MMLSLYFTPERQECKQECAERGKIAWKETGGDRHARERVAGEM